MILSWISHAVEPHLGKGVVHAETTHQVWDDFKHQFSQQNAPTIYQIQKKIASLSQGTRTVSAYFIELKDLWNQLDANEDPFTCNLIKEHNEQRDKYRMMEFLMGLNDVHDTVRSSILMMTPLPNVHQTYSFVSNHEQQRQLSNNNQQQSSNDIQQQFSLTTAAQGRSFKSSYDPSKHCNHYNRDGHSIDNCRTLKFHCNFCDKGGHIEDRC